MEIKSDHHLGLEVVNCYTKYFDHHEAKLNGLIDKLAMSNVEVKIISDVMNKLSHAKQRDKQADFSKDEEMKRHIVYIHKNNPTVFENLIQNFPDYFPEDDAAVSEITVDGVLNHGLKNVDMSRINIDVLKEDQIDVVVQGLDAELKSHSAELNHHMMKVNEAFDNRSQMTESARTVVKQANDLLESINRKMAR
jgi:hypothetical protein